MEPPPETASKFCVFCCYSFTQRLKIPKVKEKNKLEELYDELSSFYSCGSRTNVRNRGRFPSGQLDLLDLEKLFVCTDCLSLINSAMEMRQKAKEVEILVNYLQRQLQVELKKLQECMEEFGEGMRMVEETVRNSDENSFTFVVNQTGLDREKKQEIEWLRKGVLEIGAGLQLYKSNLDRKLTSGADRKRRFVKCKGEKFEPVKKASSLRALVSSSDKTDPSYPVPVPMEHVAATLEDYDTNELDDGDHFDNVGESEMEDSNGGYNNDIELDIGPTDTEVSGGQSGSDYEGESRSRKAKTKAKPKSKKRVRGNSNKSNSTMRPKSLSMNSAERYRQMEEHGVNVVGMSNLMKEFVMRALGRMQARDEYLQKIASENPPVQIKVEHGDPNAIFDDFWYRTKFITEYHPENGFSIGGIQYIVNEEDGFIYCSQCEYRTRLPKNGGKDARYKEKSMYQHILGNHLNVYRCLRCGDVQFKSEHSYREHIRSHLEISKHKCDICGKNLLSAPSLIAHRFTHMNKAEAEIYKAELDQKSAQRPTRKRRPDSGKEISDSDLIESSHDPNELGDSNLDNNEGSCSEVSEESESEYEGGEGRSKAKTKSKKKGTNSSKSAKRLCAKSLSMDSVERYRQMEEYGVDVVGMSKLMREFIMRAVGRMKARDEYLLTNPSSEVEEPTKKIKVENEDPNAKYDDFWFRKKYITEYHPEIGLNVGGVQFIVNEDDGFIFCSLCEYKADLPQNGKNRDSRYKEKMMYQHILGYHLKAYTCLRCGVEFKAEASYRDHIRNHLEPLSHKCDICGRTVGTATTLIAHKFTHMNEEEKEEARKNDPSRYYTPRANRLQTSEQFLCSICPKSFNLKEDLKRHVKRHDKAANTVMCPKCGKHLNKYSYEKHHKLYVCPEEGMEPRSVSCVHCNKSFKNKRLLYKHKKKEHNATTSAPTSSTAPPPSLGSTLWEPFF